MASIRYIVEDVEAAVEFYCTHLGFETAGNMSPNFASVRRDDIELWLAGPGASASRPMPDGAQPVAGSWNRFVLKVDDIEATVARLKRSGVQFRNEIVRGPGGAQILALDPSGNVVELFQPAS